MQAARRTVTLMRSTHLSKHPALPESSRPTLSQPRHFFASPQSPHPTPNPTLSYLPQTRQALTPHSSLSSSPATPLSIGLLSGTLGAMGGIGGAVFAIPALVRFASLPQRVAAGSSLAAVTAVAAAGAASFNSANALDLSVAAPLSVAAAVATPFGARLATLVDAAVLRRALGVFMLALAPALPARQMLAEQRQNGANSLDSQSLQQDSSQQSLSTWQALATPRTAIFASAGAAVGVTSGMLGISGGSLFTPLIAVACPDMPFRTVMGTSFAAMIVPTAVGALSYARMRLVAPTLLPALVLGASVGAKLGATIALSVPDQVLHYAFAAMFAVMGLRTLKAPIANADKVKASAKAAASAAVGQR